MAHSIVDDVVSVPAVNKFFFFGFNHSQGWIGLLEQKTTDSQSTSQLRMELMAVMATIMEKKNKRWL
jgi:hypothetical protein